MLRSMPRQLQRRIIILLVALGSCLPITVLFARVYDRYDGTTRVHRWPSWPLRSETSLLYGPAPASSVTVVVASQKSDDTTWLEEGFPAWTVVRYIVNDLTSKHRVPKNKGRESMAYLTYIIDNYDRLPEIIVFSHARRYQWHNDDPLYDGARVLQHLQLPTVRAEGYVNLRCVHRIGCPAEIRLLNHEDDASAITKGRKVNDTTRYYYKDAFEVLFPEFLAPATVAVACCAQFAVTSQQIHKRPLEDYQRYRNWLLTTDLPDDISGRIMEYSWHVIFGREPVHCPSAAECYCKTYGKCNLICDIDGACRNQWFFPPSSKLPPRWPDYGWKNEYRDIAVIRRWQELDYSAS